MSTTDFTNGRTAVCSAAFLLVSLVEMNIFLQLNQNFCARSSE